MLASSGDRMPPCGVPVSVLGVALELDGRELPGEKQVERVVHEQIRQHGRDR